MGTDRSGTYLRGVLVPDPRISGTAVLPKTHGTAPASYTQAGAATGPAVADQDTDLLLRTSGTQAEDGDLEIRTHRAGGIGPEQAAFTWRDVAAGDSTSNYKGWDPYGLVTGWETLLYTAIATGKNPRPRVIRLQSGKLLAVYSVTTLGVIRASVYAPSTSAWTSVNFAPTGGAAGYITPSVALVQLPSGRVLAFVGAYDNEQVDLYFSDDDGANWSAGGYRILDVGLGSNLGTLKEWSAAYSAGEIMLCALWERSGSGQKTATQYVSFDLGGTFREVVNDLYSQNTEAPVDLDIIPARDGGFLAFYRDTTPASDIFKVRSFASGADGWDSDTTVVTIDYSTDHASCAWRDEDGYLYGLVHAAANTGPILYRSKDEGSTWDQFASALSGLQLHDGTGTNRLESWGAASVGGRTCLLTRWNAGTATLDPYSVGVVWLGGYSNHTAPASSIASGWDFQDTDYIQWGEEPISGREGGLWLPVETPASVDWTAANTGTATFTLVSPGAGEFVSSGDTYSFYRNESGSQSQGFYEFSIECDSGSLTTLYAGILLRLADASSYQYTISIRTTDTAFRLYDEEAGSAVGSDVTGLDLSGARLNLRISMNKGEVLTWYSVESNHGHIRTWTAGPGGSLTDGGATANPSRIEFGNIATGTATFRCFFAGFNLYSGQWVGSNYDEAAEGWTNPSDLHPRTYPAADDPTLVKGGVYIGGLRGPTWLGDTFRIQPVYDHGVSLVDPAVAPSPSRGWESTADNVNVAIPWDLESEAGFSDSYFESSSIGCFLRNSNLKQCRFQGWNGASWDDLITLDATAGFSGLAFTRKGRMVYPNTGGAAPTAERWLFHQAHAGDTILLTDGETDQPRKIASNAEGGWRSGTKLARIALETDDLTGTEHVSGTCEIWRRNFGAVRHNLTTAYKYVRLYIPAHETADGVYKIGSLLIGPLFVFGLQPGKTWAKERAFNIDLQTQAGGQRSARRRGPKRRAVEISWAEQAQDTSRAWDSEPVPDYVTGVTAGDPVASIADTAYQLLGLAERLDGSLSPVVYLSRIARGAGSHTYSIDTEWVYGRLLSDSVSIDAVTGDEGVSEVVRANRIRIEEEV